MSNFRNVLKVFTMMRDFEPDDHALLNTLRSVTEAEREMLVEALGPVRRTTAKRTRKPANHSPRAASLAGAIASNVRPLGGVSKARCTASVDDNGGQMACLEYADANIHHMQTDPNYHPFTPAAAQAAAGGE